MRLLEALLQVRGGPNRSQRTLPSQVNMRIKHLLLFFLIFLRDGDNQVREKRCKGRNRERLGFLFDFGEEVEEVSVARENIYLLARC